MQPTPQRQDSLTVPARAHIAWQAAHIYGAPAGPTVLAFAAQLSDPLAEEFWVVLRALENFYETRQLAQERTVWDVLTAHLPGLAPTLELIRAHVQADTPACQDLRRDEPPYQLCRLAREAGYEG